MFRITTFSLAAAALLLTAAPALAARPTEPPPTTLPNAEYDGFVLVQPSTGYADVTGPGVTQVGSSLVNIAGGNAPSVFAFAQATTFPEYGASAIGDLKYYFSVTGEGTDPVLMHAHVVALIKQLNTDIQAGTTANVYITGYNSSAQVNLGMAPGFDGQQSYDDVQDFWVMPGIVNYVSLHVTASLSADGEHFRGYGYAYADPDITIDGAFGGFSLAFSDGYRSGNGAPPPVPGSGTVPEPAAWALMIMGFGGVGVTLRRSRRMFA